MATCSQCGHISDHTFQITKDGRIYTFDSFDCAIQALASICPYCHGRIIGVGVKENGKTYCSQQCALFDVSVEKLLHGNFNSFQSREKVANVG
jgi:hypothetical protein